MRILLVDDEERSRQAMVRRLCVYIPRTNMKWSYLI